jgi:hypothetical protein
VLSELSMWTPHPASKERASGSAITRIPMDRLGPDRGRKLTAPTSVDRRFGVSAEVQARPETEAPGTVVPSGGRG